ncbi:DUF5011 domain-containing protein [Candidatus Gracilibacteria bacterium]|nr:DUF5011 domain-containing protein [Candidatus Gracilibacteria bacterium]
MSTTTQSFLGVKTFTDIITSNATTTRFVVTGTSTLATTTISQLSTSGAINASSTLAVTGATTLYAGLTGTSAAFSSTLSSLTHTPVANLTSDIGSSALRWNNVYTGSIFATSSVITNGSSTGYTATNLYSTLANLGTVTSGLINGQTISSAANFTGSLTAISGLITLATTTVTKGNITDLTSASGTIALFNSTNASTTNLSVSNNSYFGNNTGIWNGSGNVGIGTISPGSKLEVRGDNDQLWLSTLGTYSSIYPYASGVNTGALYWDNTGGTFLEGRTATGYLRFGTGGAGLERMRITSTGNIGIGTTTPNSKLVISGGDNSLAVFGPNTTYNGLLTVGSTNLATGNTASVITTNGNLHLDAKSTFATYLNYYSGNVVNFGNGANGVVGSVSNAGVLNMNGSGTFGTNAVINGSGASYFNGGNVGIGTNAPGAKLDIVNSAASGEVTALTLRQAISGTNYDSETTATALEFRLPNNVDAYGSVAGKIVAGKDDPIWTTGSFRKSNLQFYTANGNTLNNVEAMRITSSGNIGIGTTSPSQKLDVWGNLNIATGSIPTLFANTTTGNVGIGTSTPATALQVNSSAQEVARIVSSNISGSYMSFYGNTLSASGLIGSELAVSGGAGAVTDLGLRTAGNMFFHTGGSATRMTIGSSGNVGIGTTSPSNILQTYSANGPRFDITGTGDNNTLILNQRNGYAAGGRNMIQFSQATTPSTNMRFGYDYDSTSLQFRSAIDSALFTVQNAGNVGVGTSNPGARLDVRPTRVSGTNADAIYLSDSVTGAQTAGYGTRIIGSSNAGSAISGIGFETGGDGTNNQTQLSFYTQALAGTPTFTPGNARMTIDASGNIGIGTTTPVAKFDTSGVIRALTTTDSLPTTGTGIELWYNTSNDYGFISATNRTLGQYRPLYISSAGTYLNSDAGNVGIGTTTPAYKLDVYGASRFADIMRFGSEQGFITWGGGIVNAFNVAGDNGKALSFGSNGIYDRMVLDTSGNFGIGTTSPSQKLDVWGNLNIATGSTPTLFANTATGNVGVGTANPVSKLNVGGDVTINSGSKYYFSENGSNPDTNWSLGYNVLGGGNLVTGAGVSQTIFNGSGYGYLIKNTSGTPLFEIQGSDGKAIFTGNVGIGTTNPLYKFMVQASSGNNPTVFVANNDFVNAVSGSGLYLSTGSTTGATYSQIQAFTSGNNAAGDLIFNPYGGNIGIGTSTPSADFELARATNAELKVSATDGVNDRFAKLSLHGSGNGGAILGGAIIDFTDTDSTPATPGALSITKAGSTYLTILNGGNVGIGTTSPSYKLDVVGAPRFNAASGPSQTALAVFNNLTNGGYTTITGAGSSSVVPTWIDGSQILEFVPYSTGDGIIDSYSGSLQFQTARNNRMTILNNGNVGIGTSTPSYGFVSTSATSSFRNIIPEATLSYNLGASSSRFFEGWISTLNIGTSTWSLTQSSSSRFSIFDAPSGQGTERFSILSNGNVGIGTTTPSQKLSISGNLQLTGALFDGTNASGTLGQVLLSMGTSTRWVSTSSLGLSSGASVTGGVFGYATRWLSNTTLGTSTLIDNGVFTGINATSSSYVFNVQATSTSNLSPFNVASSTGVSLFTILANGNVGIGTSTPTQSFSVQKDGNYQLQLSNLNTGGGTWNIGQSDNAWASGGNSLVFVPDSTNSSNAKVVFSNSGNVGIGTTSPSQKLDVWGTIQASGVSNPTINIGALNKETNGSSTLQFYAGTGGSYNGASIQYNKNASVDRLDIIDGSGGPRVSFLNGGNVGINTTAPNEKLQTVGRVRFDDIYIGQWSSNSRMESNNASTFYLGTGVAQDMILRTNGSDVLTLKNGGNVGIGTTSPSQKLDVWGNLNIATGSTPTLLANTATGLVGIGVATPNRKLDIRADSDTLGLDVTNTTGKIWQRFTTGNQGNEYGRFEVIPQGVQYFGTQQYFNFSNVKVGVGISTPVSALQITNDVAALPTTGVYQQLEVTGRTSSANRLSLGVLTSAVGGISSGTGIIQSLINASQFTNTIINPQGGNVGIGLTTSPTDKLQVGGNITPSSDLGGSLGSSTLRFLNQFSQNIFATSSYITTSTVYGNETIGGTLTVADTATFNKTGLTTAAANYFNSGSNVIATQFGSGSTAGFTANQYGGAFRFNGAGVAWGDMSYYPNGGGNGNQGNFRLSTTGSALSTTPSGKLGVGELYSAGSVGIGTTTPLALLTVYGAADSGPTPTNKGIIQMAVSNTNGLSFGSYSAAPFANWIQSIDHRSGAGTVYPISLNPAGGNVGIGTTSPTLFKLQVAGHVGPDSDASYDLASPSNRYRNIYTSGPVITGGYENLDNDNLLYNGDFETNSTIGWTGITTVTTGGYSGNYTSQTTGSATLLSDDYIPVDPVRDVLQLEGWFKKTVIGSPTPGILYFGYIAYNASKAAITSAPCGTYCYFAAAGTTIPNDGAWHKYSATTNGEGSSYPNFPVGTKYIRVLTLINYAASSNEVTQMDHVTLKRINYGPLFVGNNFSSTNLVDQNQSTQLYTTAANNFIITPPSSGNVGIGTTTPTQALTVVGRMFSSNNSYTNSGLVIKNTTATGVGDWRLMHFGGGSFSLNYNGDSSGDSKFLVDTSGNVGIGTTTPAYKLNIYGGNATAKDIFIGNWDANATYNAINLNGLTGVGNYNFISSASNNHLYINRPSGADINFRENNTDQVVIKTSTGNVGIGTSSPVSKLDVWGNLNIATGSTPTLFANTLTGNVGLGTSNPGTKLQVVDPTLTGQSDVLSIVTPYTTQNVDRGTMVWRDASNVTGSIATNYTSGVMAMTFGSLYNNGYNRSEVMRITGQGRVGIGTTTPVSTFSIKGTAGTNPLTISSSTNASLFTILQDGNVGIGTASPSSKLEITTTGLVGMQINTSNTSNSSYPINLNRSTTGVQSAFNYTTAGVDKWFVGQDNDATENFNIYSWTSGKWVMRAYDATGDIGFGNNFSSLYVKNSGNVGIGTTAPTALLSVSSTTANGTTNLLSVASSAPILNVLANGNVGLSNSNPSYKLDVNGDIRYTGKIVNNAGVKSYSVAVGSQGNTNNTYELMRISRDSGNWSSKIPYEVTVYNSYYRGAVTKWLINYNQVDSGSATAVESNGLLPLRLYLGSEVVVSGNIKYVPVLIDLPNYQAMRIEVKYDTNEVSTISADAQVQFTGTLSAGSGTNYNGNVQLASSGGNVGIGTSTPAAKLDVYGGDIKQDVGTYNLALSAGSTITGSNHLIINAANSYLNLQANNNNILFTQNSVNPLVSEATGAVANTLYLKQGRVGIGTAVPQAALNVHQTGTVNEQAVFSNTGTYHTGIAFTSTANYQTDAAAWGVYGGPNTYLTGLANRVAVILPTSVPDFSIMTGATNLNSSNATVKFTVLQNGNVGIGTSTPTQKLEVNGITKTASIYSSDTSYTSGSPFEAVPGGASDNTSILNITPGGGYGNWIKFSNNPVVSNNSNPWIGAVYNSAYSQDLLLYSARKGNIAHGTNIAALNMRLAQDYIGFYTGTNSGTSQNTEKMRLDSTGNLGIGTTTPIEKLTVQGSGTGFVSIGAYTPDPTYGAITLGNTNSSTAYNFASRNTGADAGNLYINRISGKDIEFRENGSPQMIMKSGGNFGIGTTTPASKLTVLGSAYTSGTLVSGANSNNGDWVQYSDTFDGTSVNTNNWTTTGTVTQNNNITTTGASAWTNRGITSTQTYRRNNSLTLTMDVTPEATTNYAMYGWSSGTTMDYTNMPHAIYFVNTGVISIYENGVDRGSTGYAYSAATTYRIKIVTSATGALYYISNNGGDTWTKLYDGTANNITNSPLYVRATVYNGSPTIDNLTVSNGVDVFSSSQLVSKNFTVGNGNLLINVGNVGIGTTSPVSTLSVRGTAGINPFTIASSTGASLFTILQNGNVGIGSSTPVNLLSVAGTASISNLKVGPGVINNGGAGYGSAMSVAGTIDMQGNSLMLNVGGSSSYFLNSQTLSIGFAGAGNITTVTGVMTIAPQGGSSLLLQPSSGNVGIGTTTPAQKLSVTGNMQLTGALFDGTNASGTYGKVLWSTGTSTQWVSTSSLGISGGGVSASTSAMTVGNLYATSTFTSTGLSSLSTTTISSLLFGTSTAFSTANVNMDTFVNASGSTYAVAGTYGNFTFNPIGGGTQVGNRFVMNNIPTGTANTSIGEIIRTVDNTTLANTVRGIEVVSSAGSNTAGINTGIRTTGYTFGLQSFTSGLAAGVSIPAAIYGQNTGSTQGNILRLYTESMTTADAMASFYQESSTFAGTGLLMNLGEGSGSFTGKFIDLQKASTTMFSVNNDGKTGIGTSTPAKELQVIGDIRVGSTGTNGCIEDFSGGNMIGTCSSDENLKTNISDISNILNKFESLRIVDFNWNTLAGNLYKNSTTATNTGYLAQNVESIFPELVVTNKEGYKQVNYTKLGLYAVEGVKELSIANNQSSSTITSLSNTVKNNFEYASSSIFNLAAITSSNYAQASSSISALSNVINNNYLEASSTFQSIISVLNASTTNLQTQLNNISNKINITNAPTNALTISSIGLVGIGNDGTQIGDELLRVSGRIRATGFDVDSAADISEVFASDEPIEAGTLVAFSSSTYTWNPNGKNASSESNYEMSGIRVADSSHTSFGIVTTKAGIVLGSSFSNTATNTVPVALTGRVPVKVTSENGFVKRGDYLVISNTIPGYAMLQKENGRTIGQALSDASTTNATSTVIVFIENTNRTVLLSNVDGLTSITVSTSTGTVKSVIADAISKGIEVVNSFVVGKLTAVFAYIDTVFAREVYAEEKLCVGNTCVTEEQLKNLLNNSPTPSVQTSEPLVNTGTSTASTTPETITPNNSTTTVSTTPETSTSTETVTASTTEEVTPPAPVLDTIAPVITINGSNPETVSVSTSTPYTDQGATALDDIDGVTSVTTSGTVDITTIGTYTITYTSTDLAGNTATKDRVVGVE